MKNMTCFDNCPKMEILGSVKIGARGQIVIPKKARDQFKIESSDEILFLGSRFGRPIIPFIKISRYEKIITENDILTPNFEISKSVVVGNSYQIVIPVELRDKFGFKQSDRVIIRAHSFGLPSHQIKLLEIVPAEKMKNVAKHIMDAGLFNNNQVGISSKQLTDDFIPILNNEINEIKDTPERIKRINLAENQILDILQNIRKIKEELYKQPI